MRKAVNAFVATAPLPPEYAVLELSTFVPWTPLDTVTVSKLLTFGLSFDLDDISRTTALLTYQQAGAALGFDGTKLFFEDLFRSAPFDPASTIPDASIALAKVDPARSNSFRLDDETLALGKQYLEKVKHISLFESILEGQHRASSNQWVISGRHTTSGLPLLANDQHLSLDTPSVFYPVHLAAGPIDAIGNGFAGVPLVIVGHNRHIAWGATVNPMDVTDVFQEHVVPDPTSPSGLSIVHNGQTEPIIPIPEVFRTNQIGDGVLDNLAVVPPGGSMPSATLVVPRRNNGPIIQLDLGRRAALSVQYTGFSATRELETFLIWNEAKNLNDFQQGLQFFHVGSQNWVYADAEGNIAYFTSGEMPIREDLQAGVVSGLPPFFIRDGTGGNEWLAVQTAQPNQAVPFEILPFAEMPHIINPPAGWLVNSNNDPLGLTLDNNPLNQLRPGGGIYYLNPGYDGFRAGRITQLIKQKLSTGSGKISFTDVQKMQADTGMIDAQVFAPYILQAFAHARALDAHPLLAALGANPSVAEAVSRLERWDFTTPTGIPEGYDASDVGGTLSPPSDAEVASSVAATLYGVWRGRFIRNTIDAPLNSVGLPKPPNQQTLSALRHLLDNFSTNQGRGASGLDFFNVPGVTIPTDRRDILILQSLSDALDLLAGPSFASAFGNSTNQNDYRWGKLHRVILKHPLAGPFSIPPAGGAYPSPLPGLPGIPSDGGFETVDRSDHGVRASGADDFMFDAGPASRLVVETAPGRIHGESSSPGGVSGVLRSPFYFNLLQGWLTNEAFPLLQRQSDLRRNALSVTEFTPAK